MLPECFAHALQRRVSCFATCTHSHTQASQIQTNHLSVGFLLFSSGTISDWCTQLVHREEQKIGWQKHNRQSEQKYAKFLLGQEIYLVTLQQRRLADMFLLYFRHWEVQPFLTGCTPPLSLSHPRCDHPFVLTKISTFLCDARWKCPKYSMQLLLWATLSSFDLPEMMQRRCKNLPECSA